MEYSPNTSYVKNVAIPRYPPINPYQGQRPQYEPMKPSADSAAFQNNAAFHNNSQYVPIYHDFDEARSRQIQNRNEWQYQALKPSLKSTIANSTPAQAINTKPSLDYHFILLSLAEDYFAIAHGKGSLTALVHGEMDMQTYYKLIATGLGCLEAVLKVKIMRCA